MDQLPLSNESQGDEVSSEYPMGTATSNAQSMLDFVAQGVFCGMAEFLKRNPRPEASVFRATADPLLKVLSQTKYPTWVKLVKDLTRSLQKLEAS